MIDGISAFKASSRAGASLIEALIVMTMIAVISGISLQMLVGLTEAMETDQVQFERNEQLSRLGEFLREDLHAAKRSRIVESEEATGLVVELPGGRVVRYALASRGILLTRQVAETISGSREFFDLDSTFIDARWSRRISVNQRPLVRLTIRFHHDANRSSQVRTWTIEAIEGLHP